MIRRSILTALLFALPLAAFSAAEANAQAIPAYVTASVNDAGRPAADTARDADRKPAESVAFAGVKPGDKVLELLSFGGYYTRILSKIVGPTGHVYATMPTALLAARPAAADALKAIAADPAYSNVTVLIQPTGAPSAPVPVDVVWTSLNYHDLHNPGPFGAGDIPGFNKAVLAALKPGGSFIVIDHAAKAGAGLTQTGTLHRIDPDTAKAEILAGGFTFAGQSDALHRPNDDYTAHSTDKDDQFIFKFRKP
jgi:predicted methyltransferase